MFSFPNIVKLWLSLAIALTTCDIVAYSAEVLKGSVTEEETLLRLNRNSQKVSPDGTIPFAPARITRPASVIKPQTGLVDVNQFKPLTGKVNQDNANLQGEQARSDSNPNSKFDLGADRNSQALVLAWERWHHQLSQEIYRRWQGTVDVPGRITLKMTVNRNRTIQVTVTRSSGNSHFDRSLLDVIESLNGNPGLTFPSKSQRQFVNLEADYIAGTDVNPGFSWIKDDYERVQGDR